MLYVTFLPVSRKIFLNHTILVDFNNLYLFEKELFLEKLSENTVDQNM